MSVAVRLAVIHHSSADRPHGEQESTSSAPHKALHLFGGIFAGAGPGSAVDDNRHQVDRVVGIARVLKQGNSL